MSFDHDHGLHVMSRHVAQVREGSGMCRCELKLNQALSRDNHTLESVWAELRGSIATHVEVGAEEKFLGYHGVKFCVVAAEP